MGWFFVSIWILGLGYTLWDMREEINEIDAWQFFLLFYALIVWIFDVWGVPYVDENTEEL